MRDQAVSVVVLAQVDSAVAAVGGDRPAMPGRTEQAERTAGDDIGPTGDGRSSLPRTGERPAGCDRDVRGFLVALQLGDSLFPSGGFTLSHGLETLAEHGLVTSAAGLAEWLGMTLTQQVGSSDGVAAAAAWDAAGDPVTTREIDALLLATKLAREPREASVRTGRQLLSVLATLLGEIPAGSRSDARSGHDAPRENGRAVLAILRADVLAGRSPGTHAVVLGVAGRALGLGRRETVLLLLHLHVAGCIGAALRLLDVDDVEMQRVRLDLVPTLGAAMEAALATPWKEMYACAPQTELMIMLHERATVRLFAT